MIALGEWSHGKHAQVYEFLQERIRLWRELDYPSGFPGDPRDWEKKNAKTASLTPLGEKLLGLARWSS